MMFLDFLFPCVCVGCGNSGFYLCGECKKSLRPHDEICPFTHKPSPGYAVRQDLLTLSNPLDGCIVLFRFEPLIKKLIRQLKYYHRADIGNFLGERLSLALQSHELLQGQETTTKDSQIIVSFVPSHRYRHYITKGYNQSELLSQALIRSLSKSFPKITTKSLCKKTKNTHSQVGMSREERKTNLSDAFSITQPIAPGSVIVVVDDVLTSGATLIEMAKTIKKSQSDCQVWGLCVARNG